MDTYTSRGRDSVGGDADPAPVAPDRGGPVLRFVDVVKAFGAGQAEVRALNGVTLDVQPGEFVAVMGPSGCGKSTLLHLAGALEDPTAGSVWVQGRDLSTLDAGDRASLRRRDVGYVFQRLNLVPSLTAIENVMLPLELDGVPARRARQQAEHALGAVGLDRQLDRYPDHFSGGQQQRIAIARATVGTRRLLLADEPTGALDTLTADRVIDLLASLPSEHGTAVVLVTHEPRFASWADRVVYLRDGRIVSEARAAAVGPLDDDLVTVGR
jgi:putative ABC transport system ATP-binding protein